LISVIIVTPTGNATEQNFGNGRPGLNLYATTLLALRASTGKRVWHFQIVHHDIWDRDNAAAPILADITVGGRRIEAVVQLSKQAYAYVFDRVTGTPVWPIVEQAVPQSDVPGEKTAATQPIPSKPAAFDRQSLAADDLIDFTPELHAEALKALAAFKTGGGPFAPPSVDNGAGGTRGTLLMPGNLGGANWEGGAFDPETGWLYVGSWTNPSVIALVKDPQL
jgi:quinoprotein glucose dehydrogenase